MTLTARPVCPSWTLRAWPPLLWQADCSRILHLQHLGTQVTHPGDGFTPLSGQTIWAGHEDEGDAGVAWDWIQVADGVVAMADPMSVVSNLRLVGPRGECLTAFEAARHLNEIVYMLPWQHEVGRVLGATPHAPPAAAKRPPGAQRTAAPRSRLAT